MEERHQMLRAALGALVDLIVGTMATTLDTLRGRRPFLRLPAAVPHQRRERGGPPRSCFGTVGREEVEYELVAITQRGRGSSAMPASAARCRPARSGDQGEQVFSLVDGVIDRSSTAPGPLDPILAPSTDHGRATSMPVVSPDHIADGRHGAELSEDPRDRAGWWMRETGPGRTWR